MASGVTSPPLYSRESPDRARSIASIANVASLIIAQADARPAHPALVIDHGPGAPLERVSFAALAGRAAVVADQLQRDGLGRGSRVLALLPPSLELYALALAVLARGMTLVVVDGTLARPRLLAALNDAAPDAVVATGAVMRRWPLVRALRRATRYTVGARVPGTRSLGDGRRIAPLRALPMPPDAPAVLSFTSGSGGRAKVVARSQGVLAAQHRALRALFPLAADAVNLTAFPVAALHNLCCGVTTVLPAGRDDDAATLALVERAGVTTVSASPARLERLANAILAGGRPCATVAGVVAGGGPVSRRVCDAVLRAFPTADAWVLYGASEAEPIAAARMTEVRDTAGDGFLVGRPVPECDVRLAGNGSAGQVLVRGAHVVTGADGWHRTGDVATIDAAGRLWLLGTVDARLATRVAGDGARPLHPFAVEAALLAMPGVRAAALVAHAGAPRGELAIALASGASAARVVAAAREQLAALGAHDVTIRLVDDIPMDPRHESKVLRGVLRERLARSGAR